MNCEADWLHFFPFRGRRGPEKSFEERSCGEKQDSSIVECSFQKQRENRERKEVTTSSCLADARVECDSYSEQFPGFKIMSNNFILHDGAF